jgi:asparagine synthase (glutamine-hydrolysing)
MSGIVGIYYLDGQPVESDQLEQMLSSIAHRGSDEVNLWCQGNVGLGHRMLWTTPESLLEHLPLVNSTGELVITADARIDNRDELIYLLELNSIPKDKITDSAIILAAYEKWGEQCPEKLIGDFAFVIWDEHNHKIFCARDSMGIKPLYYYKSHQIFAFASEIKSLFCLPEVPRRLNELKIGYYLAMFAEDKEITFYENIYRLKPSHFLSISLNGKSQLKSYWSLEPSREIRLTSQQEYVEAFLELFTESVRCRLRSAFPMGSTLSGGLDSSSIACTARKILAESGSKQQLHTFSATFASLPEQDLRKIDERYYMNVVKSLGGFHAHDIRADLLSPLMDFLWQEEEAIFSPNIYIHNGMYNCAKQNGVRVFLDGVDGDTTISHGWLYLTELTYKGRWRTLNRELKLTAKHFRLGRRKLIQKFCLEPLLHEPLTYTKQKLMAKLNLEKLENEFINPDFAKKIQLTPKIQALSQNDGLVLTGRKEHYLSFTTGLYPYAMEITDKASSKHSLEARYPFFDRRLMEFCLALPPELKFNQGWSRAILRYGMQGILPPEVQWRVSKANLGKNFERNLLTMEKKILDRVIKKPHKLAPYVNLAKLKAAYDRYTNQVKARSDDDLNVFNAVTLGLWLEQF